MDPREDTSTSTHNDSFDLMSLPSSSTDVESQNTNPFIDHDSVLTKHSKSFSADHPSHFSDTKFIPLSSRRRRMVERPAQAYSSISSMTPSPNNSVNEFGARNHGKHLSDASIISPSIIPSALSRYRSTTEHATRSCKKHDFNQNASSPNLLACIAEKERACLDLKEELDKSEAQLHLLKAQWLKLHSRVVETVMSDTSKDALWNQPLDRDLMTKSTASTTDSNASLPSKSEFATTTRPSRAVSDLDMTLSPVGQQQQRQQHAQHVIQTPHHRMGNVPSMKDRSRNRRGSSSTPHQNALSTPGFNLGFSNILKPEVTDEAFFTAKKWVGSMFNTVVDALDYLVEDEAVEMQVQNEGQHNATKTSSQDTTKIHSGLKSINQSASQHSAVDSNVDSHVAISPDNSSSKLPSTLNDSQTSSSRARRQRYHSEPGISFRASSLGSPTAIAHLGQGSLHVPVLALSPSPKKDDARSHLATKPTEKSSPLRPSRSKSASAQSYDDDPTMKMISSKNSRSNAFAVPPIPDYNMIKRQRNQHRHSITSARDKPRTPAMSNDECHSIKPSQREYSDEHDPTKEYCSSILHSEMVDSKSRNNRHEQTSPLFYRSPFSNILSSWKSVDNAFVNSKNLMSSIEKSLVSSLNVPLRTVEELLSVDVTPSAMEPSSGPSSVRGSVSSIASTSLHGTHAQSGCNESSIPIESTIHL